MFRQIGILLLVSIGALTAAAQDTLPKFTLVNKGNGRIVTSWTNPYKNAVHQLSIQRSFDSTRNFKTILTLPDPTVPQNGYVDTKAPTEHMFYRLYILLDSGRYQFSASKRPAPDTAKAVVRSTESPKPPDDRIAETPVPDLKKPVTTPPVKPKEAPDNTSNEKTRKETPPVKETPPEIIKPKEIPERIIYVKKRDTLIAQVGERSLKHFKDSLAFKTKDTLTFNTPDTIEIKPFVPKEVYKPSKYVFTEKDGNIRIALPDASLHKYSLKFFEENNSPVFEVKQVKDASLILDKANFLHSGWFRFELYQDGVLKEKNKFFIPKDF
jgi:hypothetical protein